MRIEVIGKFQFHTGSIKSRLYQLLRRPDVLCFNSILVRLKVNRRPVL